MGGFKGSLLLVEDDAVLASRVEAIMRADGYAVTPCSTTEDARGIWRDFDLLMLDMNLEGTGGLHLLSEVREVSQVPVMVAASDKTAAVTALETDSVQAVGMRLRVFPQ